MNEEKHDQFDIAVNLLGVGMIKEAEKTIDTDRYKSINLIDFLKEQTEIGIKEKTHINYKIYNEDTGEMKIIVDRCYIDYERKRYADRLKRFLYQFRKPF